MPSTGAGHGEKGDALNLGPAQERLEPLPEQPKPTYADAVTTSDGAPSPVIELAARTTKPEAAEATAVTREADGLVMTHPKPEKRKNARERARDKYAKDGTTPTMTAKAKSKVDKKAKTKAETKAKKKSKSAARKAA